MSLRITVTDQATGDTDDAVVLDGDYIIICADPCRLERVQAHANGTHVLTVKGRAR